MIDPFWISFSTIVAGVFSGFLVMLHKSKCKNTSCLWGCFNCQRDVEIEEQIEITNRNVL
jgi:hypothetical protein